MSAPRTVELRYDAASLARNVVLICFSIELLFFTLDFNVNYAEGASVGAIRRLFNTALEDSLPAWFGIMQTAALAATVWLIFLVVRRTGSRWQTLGWGAIAAFFTYLAFDDGAHIHERIGTFYEEAIELEGAATSGLGGWTASMFPSYEWQLVFLPAFALMGLFTFGFLLRELRGWAPKLVVFAAMACLAGAILLDFFEGLAPDHPLNVYAMIAERYEFGYWTARTFNSTEWDTLQHFSRSIEECVEMFAMTLLWGVFLSHLGVAWRDVRVSFVDGDPSAAPGLDGVDEPDRELRLAA